MQKNLKKHMLENGQTFFRKSRDGRKLRLAIWTAKKKKVHGTVFFLNGHREFIEKYSETYDFFIKKGFNVITLDWRGWGLSERPFPFRPKGSAPKIRISSSISTSPMHPSPSPTFQSSHPRGCSFQTIFALVLLCSRMISHLSIWGERRKNFAATIPRITYCPSGMVGLNVACAKR